MHLVLKNIANLDIIFIKSFLQDREGWKKLNQRIGEKCFIVGSDLYRKHSSILECGVTEKLSSVVALSVDQANTITGLSQMAKTAAG